MQAVLEPCKLLRTVPSLSQSRALEQHAGASQLGLSIRPITRFAVPVRHSGRFHARSPEEPDPGDRQNGN